jgi:adenine/guanine/hypoxanthine permease
LLILDQLVDGIGTAISSFFGSPFGTVIYIGHPMHKRNGAKVGYSMVNGCIYFVFSWIGILALIESIGMLLRRGGCR